MPGKEEETEFPGSNVEIVTVDLPMARTISSRAEGGGGVYRAEHTRGRDLGPGILPKSLQVRGF